MEANQPLIAYLESLRGKVDKASGPLDDARVLQFGFPQLIPGDDLGGDPHARAATLIARLQTCIESIAATHERDGAILHHYFFGKGSENERQIAAAGEAELSDSAPRNFRPHALAQLAEELQRTAAAAAKAATRTENPADLIDDLVAILSRAYSGSHLDDLAGMVLTEAPPIYDASVTLKLKDDRSDPDSYHLTLSTVKACTHQVHFMALSPRATLSDLIFSTCPQVAEVFTCSRREQLDELAEAWVDDRDTLTVLGTDSRNRATRRAAKLTKVDREEQAAVLGELPEELHDDVVLLKADLPRSSLDPPTYLELHLPASMSRDDGYCYWLADRPTFVKTITFDASAMSLREGERFTLQPCLRATAHEPPEQENVFTIRIDSWIVRGQGALLIWG
jgi:hypothetical protein